MFWNAMKRKGFLRWGDIFYLTIPSLIGWQWGPEDISAKDMDHIIKVWSVVKHLKLLSYLLNRSTTLTMKTPGERC